jgi:acetyltransferase-like isoleucine patch superfamily enzyme
MKLAPIVFFTYKRPNHLRKTLDALQKSDLADKSTLFIYSDAPKHGASKADIDDIDEVRKLVHRYKGCREVIICERPYNFGFQNIIKGVTEVIENFDRVIVLEDDIVINKYFLAFMNEALNLYVSDDEVMHISGYMLPIRQKLPDTFFYNAASCWGWATWKRAWNYYCDDPNALLEKIVHHPHCADFDCPPYWYMQQLRDNVSGATYTWDVKWQASIFLRNGLCLHPGRSLTLNIGHDKTGENCPKTTLFVTEMSDHLPVVARIKKEEHAQIRKIIAKHYGFRAPSSPQKMRRWLGNLVRAHAGKVLNRFVPDIGNLRRNPQDLLFITSRIMDSAVDPLAKLYAPYRIENSSIGAYSYIAADSIVKNTTIGKFCSIGPGFRSGFGLHPTDGVSTSPMFYSVHKQNGMTIARNNKCIEQLPVAVGNDVYIGMNVALLDGIVIGDGAVVGAGSVVTKNVQPYSVVGGVPAKLLKHRFNETTVQKLLASRWWDGEAEMLALVEKYCFDVERFLEILEKTRVGSQ